MILTGIGDEAGVRLDAQIKAAQELGWNCLEMRAVEVPGFAKANLHDIPDKAFELAAAVTVGKSKFAPQIYRCKPVTTDYYLAVKFSPYETEQRNQDFRPATGGQMGPGGHI